MKNSIKKYVTIAIVVLLCGVLFRGIIKEKSDYGVKKEKQMIYLYPTTKQKVSVKLTYQGKLTSTYPEHKGNWNVEASPDGTLINLEDNKEYSNLSWEGNDKHIVWDFSKGFVVKGKDIGKFFEDKLSYLGLNSKERNDFITYWLPRMQNNEYNLITFAGVGYRRLAELRIEPAPDPDPTKSSTQRVFMVFKALEKPVKVEEQKLPPFNRKGFTLIEWGGCEIK